MLPTSPRVVDPVLRLTDIGEGNLILLTFCLLPRALYETAFGLEPFDVIPVSSTTRSGYGLFRFRGNSPVNVAFHSLMVSFQKRVGGQSHSAAPKPLLCLDTNCVRLNNHRRRLPYTAR